jgi:hypothetical protein
MCSKNEIIYHYKDLFTNVRVALFVMAPNWRTVHQQVSKQIMTQPHNAILVTNKKRNEVLITCDDPDET